MKAVVKKEQRRDEQSCCCRGEITNMTSIKTLLRVSLLLTGVRCRRDSLFVYSTLGGDALLPCTQLFSPDCSSISWTLYRKGRRVQYTQEIIGGQVRSDSDKSTRMFVTSNCSLSLQDLRVDDVGSYVCITQDKAVTDVYLSLLTITSPSTITDLQPGGNLMLNCILFTYYDAGSCKSYSRMFSLHWLAEDETELPNDSRYKLIFDNRCNITLVAQLQKEDNNRKWRCQVNTKENSRAAFVDFKSSFLFQNTATAQKLNPLVTGECPVQLPISRIVLCVALPVMVIMVGLFTWKLDRKRVRTSAAAFKLQEIN